VKYFGPTNSKTKHTTISKVVSKGVINKESRNVVTVVKKQGNRCEKQTAKGGKVKHRKSLIDTRKIGTKGRTPRGKAPVSVRRNHKPPSRKVKGLRKENRTPTEKQEKKE
jgi:hypothetical protein